MASGSAAARFSSSFGSPLTRRVMITDMLDLLDWTSGHSTRTPAAGQGQDGRIAHQRNAPHRPLRGAFLARRRGRHGPLPTWEATAGVLARHAAPREASS